MAADTFAENEVLFRIPRTAVLSVENSILAAEIPAATLQSLGPWLALILVMLYEDANGAASNWSPYFAVLPSEFDSLMFWSDDELAELQASAVVDKIGRAGADRLFLEQLLPVITECADAFFAGDPRAQQKAAELHSPAGLARMHRMGSLIMAYAFDMEPATSTRAVDEEGYASEDEDAALPKGMVPLADMLNADAGRCNARLFYQDRCLEMRALKPIGAGEEIFNDYGPLPRADLLRRYGYVTDNYAQYDVVEIPLELVTAHLIAADLLDQERLDYLDEQDVIDGGYDIVASSPFTLQESLSPELVMLVETLLLPGDEFDRLKRKGKLPRSEHITPKGAGLLLQILQARTAQYATSLAYDLQRTASASTSTSEHRHAMALAVRIGEKQLLKEAAEALAEMIARDGVSSKRQRSVDDEGDVDMGGTEKKQRG